MTKRFGFTLAEVLITLGIIGVVAAMTMPTLMNSTNGAQYKTAYKKALSVLSQAVVLNIALDEWNLADAVETGTNSDDLSIYSLIKNRMNVVRTASGSAGYEYSLLTSNVGTTFAEKTSGSGNYTMFFNDGIAISFPQTAAQCSLDDTRGTITATGGTTSAVGPCKGFIDVNGQKTPNKEVKCDNTGATADNCEVKNPTDIYPVIMYDQQILPNSPAARAVLYAK